MGKLEVGRVELIKELVYIKEFLQEIKDELKPSIKEGQKIIVECDDGNFVVKVDTRILRNSLFNLLSNAVKYTRRQPEARIEIAPQPGGPGEVVVRISDNGAGFDMKYADKLFGVFQRLHSTQEFEGTGVGLANVRRIVERHGGRIWAEAGGDRGASFYVSLPSHPVPATSAQTLS